MKLRGEHRNGKGETGTGEVPFREKVPFREREDRGLFKELVNEVNAGRDRSTPA